MLQGAHNTARSKELWVVSLCECVVMWHMCKHVLHNPVWPIQHMGYNHKAIKPLNLLPQVNH